MMSQKLENPKTHVLAVGLAATTCFGAVIGTSGCITTYMSGGEPHVRGGGHEGDFSFDISPKDGMVVFTATGEGEKDIYSFDLKTSKVRRLTKTVDYESDPSVSPDGKSIIYAAGSKGKRSDHIFTRSLDGTKVKQITAEDFNDTTPAFSPDGTQIAFARNLTFSWGGLAPSWGSDGAIYIMQADGTRLQRLTHDDLTATDPKFSPDGKTLVYWASTSDSKWNIFSIQLSKRGASKPQQLTRDGYSREVAVSPDGRHLAFVSDPTGAGYAGLFRLFVMKKDGTGQRQLLKSALSNKPRFSSNGKQIYFLGATKDNKFGLWRVGVNGTNLHQITVSGLFEHPISFTMTP